MTSALLPLIAVLAGSEPAHCGPVKPLSRIGVRARTAIPGEFYDKGSGKVFVPRGFNDTVLGDGGKGWHATFNVGVYDPARTRRVLDEMKNLGANTVRVWAWGEARNGGGFCGKPEDTGLNAAYMANFNDFLRQANLRGIRVVAILDEMPHNARYDSIAARLASDSDRAFGPYNKQVFSAGAIAAKAAAIGDFIRAVDANLRSTVLAWELWNEANVGGGQGPFSQTSGTVTTANGRTYDMADLASRQACWDEGIVYWANELTRAAKQADPEALVTVGMWTSDAAGPRQPVNGLSDKLPDQRFPPRPSVLAAPDCKIDFLDIHIYAWGGSDKVNKSAHEWTQLCRLGKPVLLGECGARESVPLEKAKEQLLSFRRQAGQMGYSGFLFWVWDLASTGTYTAIDDGFAAFLAGEFKDKGISK